jgi:hypothetical protein
VARTIHNPLLTNGSQPNPRTWYLSFGHTVWSRNWFASCGRRTLRPARLLRLFYLSYHALRHCHAQSAEPPSSESGALAQIPRHSIRSKCADNGAFHFSRGGIRARILKVPSIARGVFVLV